MDGHMESVIPQSHYNTLRLRQDGHHFRGNISKFILLNECIWISLKCSLEFVPTFPIITIPALVQIMAWCCPGDKPLSEPMMVNLLMHIRITRPQRVNMGIGKYIIDRIIIPETVFKLIHYCKTKISLKLWTQCWCHRCTNLFKVRTNPTIKNKS